MINLECSKGHELAHCSACGSWYCPTCQFSLHAATCDIKANARVTERFVEDKKRRLR